MFKDQTVVIGITGGIAAYKVCEIINTLRKEGATVKVIMTKNACEFITPLTIETLSGNKVVDDMFKRSDYIDVKHISLANEADIFVVVPATANILGKVANGIADDMLSTTIMATDKKVLFVPAMNNKMYDNPIVQDNIDRLKKYGYLFLEPIEGHLACGYVAKGRIPNTKDIIDFIKKELDR